METCKLCLTQKPLIKRSHIISEFFYEELYDGNHKLNSFTTKILSTNKRKIKRPSQGIYESGILCKECENSLLNKQYEDYSSKILYPERASAKINFNVIRQKMPDNLEFSHYQNVDFGKFKLFLLTNLWRAHIAKRPEFKEVNLGPHAEVIRQMLLNQDPKNKFDYPIAFLNLRNDPKVPLDLIIPSQARRDKNGNRIYVFILNGYLFAFFVNSASVRIPELFLESTITEKNEFKMFDVPKGMGWQLLLNNMGIKYLR